MLHGYSLRVELMTATPTEVYLMICNLRYDPLDQLHVGLLVDRVANWFRGEGVSFAFLQPPLLSSMLGLLQTVLEPFLVFIFRERDLRKDQHRLALRRLQHRMLKCLDSRRHPYSVLSNRRLMSTGHIIICLFNLIQVGSFINCCGKVAWVMIHRKLCHRGPKEVCQGLQRRSWRQHCLWSIKFRLS